MPEHLLGGPMVGKITDQILTHYHNIKYNNKYYAKYKNAT